MARNVRQGFVEFLEQPADDLLLATRPSEEPSLRRRQPSRGLRPNRSELNLLRRLLRGRRQKERRELPMQPRCELLHWSERRLRIAALPARQVIRRHAHVSSDLLVGVARLRNGPAQNFQGDRDFRSSRHRSSRKTTTRAGQSRSRQVWGRSVHTSRTYTGERPCAAWSSVRTRLLLYGIVSSGASPAGRCWSNAISSVASETCCAISPTRSTRFVGPPTASAALA